MAIAENHLPAGTLLNHGVYRIEKVLGQGGFGITYLAIDLSLERRVAIKEFFPKEFCNRDQTTSHVKPAVMEKNEFYARMRQKFIKEARSIAALDNPGIIKIFAAFEENNTAYYAMDYIQGANFAQIIKKDGPMDIDTAVNYITQIGHTLEYLHARHINHLDVKPANIMLRASDHQPILIDFGMSKKYDAQGNQTSSTPIGISHGFAPLEQYNNGGVSEFSPQTDLYALAATLYFLVSGQNPPSADEILNSSHGLEFPGSFPGELRAPITKAMACAKADRHTGIKEFLSHIDNSVNQSTRIVIEQSDPEPTRLWGKTGNANNRTRPDYTGQNRQNQPPKKQKISPITWVLMVLGVIIIGLLAFLIFAKLVVLFPNPSTQDSDNTTSYTDPQPVDTLPVFETQPAETPKPKDTLRDTPITQSNGTINGYDYVDLGLPSGTLWAAYNIGTLSPEGYGDYYAWGETDTQYAYTETTSQTRGYDLYDITSDPEYDPAASNWGASWQLPSRYDFKELLNICRWYWTTFHGTKGYKVVGPNGNALFLPAAGYKYDYDLKYPGNWGYYLTGNTDPDNNLKFYAFDFDKSKKNIHTGYRASGRSVRPVAKRN